MRRCTFAEQMMVAGTVAACLVLLAAFVAVTPSAWPSLLPRRRRPRLALRVA